MAGGSTSVFPDGGPAFTSSAIRQQTGLLVVAIFGVRRSPVQKEGGAPNLGGYPGCCTLPLQDRFPMDDV
eukprot:10931227-Lingulodinium_polyedra.AAC.1